MDNRGSVCALFAKAHNSSESVHFNTPTSSEHHTT